MILKPPRQLCHSVWLDFVILLLWSLTLMCCLFFSTMMNRLKLWYKDTKYEFINKPFLLFSSKNFLLEYYAVTLIKRVNIFYLINLKLIYHMEEQFLKGFKIFKFYEI